jgi:hypothetical protein
VALGRSSFVTTCARKRAQRRGDETGSVIVAPCFSLPRGGCTVDAQGPRIGSCRRQRGRDPRPLRGRSGADSERSGLAGLDQAGVAGSHGLVRLAVAPGHATLLGPELALLEAGAVGPAVGAMRRPRFPPAAPTRALVHRSALRRGFFALARGAEAFRFLRGHSTPHPGVVFLATPFPSASRAPATIPYPSASLS